MKREDFINVAEESLESLPEEFRSRIHNGAILVEDFPPTNPPTSRTAKAAASRHLSRRSHHQEERL
jgi:hypothetical protein